LLAFKRENNLTMSVISDMKRNILKEYNVFTLGTIKDNVYRKFKIAIPSTFLIDQQRQIAWVYVGSREDRPSIDLIFQVIQENLVRE
jgi:peroxiredoxin